MLANSAFVRLWTRFRPRAAKAVSRVGSGRFRQSQGGRRRLLEALEDRCLLTATPTISGLVWNDLNANGVQDVGEPGVAAAAAELFSSVDQTIGNADDVSAGVAITDASGHYQFDNLALGTQYYLAFRAPAGFGFTVQNLGNDDSIDSDADASGRTVFFTPAAYDERMDVDAGLTGRAPGIGFAIGVGGASGYDAGRGVATDAAGNIYEIGSFCSTVDFDRGPGTCELTSAGYDDVFVVKYTAAGALVWARRLGGTGNDVAHGIALSLDGSVHTTGQFSGTVDFDPGPGNHPMVASPNHFDAFVSKLDAAGNFVWAVQLGGDYDDTGYGVALGSDGGVYVTGGFQGTADFDPGPGTYSLSSGATNASDIFVVRYESSGELGWARAMGGTTWNDVGRAVALGPDGSVYTTGSFYQAADFDPGPATCLLTGRGYNVFVSKLDASGDFVWARSFGGESIDLGCGIAVTRDGNVYTTGSFSREVDFDPGPGTYSLWGTSDDAFVSKLDSSGNFGWARNIGGTYSDIGYGIALGPNGSVYTAMHFGGTVDFDPGTSEWNLTSVFSDIAVSQLDSSGNFVSARDGGGPGGGVPYAVAVTAEGRVVVAGAFGSTIDFDPGSRDFPLTATSVEDGFLWSLSPAHAPSEPRLSASTIAENQAIGTAVGTLTSADADPDDTLTYRLVAGPGDADNRSFNIEAEGKLRTAVVFDYEAKTSYQVRVRVTDHAGLWAEAALTVNVVDIDDILTVTGRVWNDRNGDGVQDSTEPGLAGAVVQAFLDFDGVRGNADDAMGDVAVTDVEGDYALSGFSSGRNYYLVVRPGAASPPYQFSPQGAGRDATADSDVSPEGLSAIFTIRAGQTTDVDAGLIGLIPGIGFAIGVGGASGYDAGYDLATDAEANVYLVGSFSGTVDFDPGPGTCSLASDRSRDIFVAKYTTAGALLWARRLGGPGDDAGRAIALGPDGTVYTTGTFACTADFDPGPGYYPLAGINSSVSVDAFISKLDADGNFVWADHLSGTNEVISKSIAVAADGNAYVTGSFTGTVDFDPGAGVCRLSTVSDATNKIFIARYEPTGALGWVRAPSGASGSGEGIVTGPDGSVFATGAFGGNLRFDSAPEVAALTSQSEDAFVLKLDPSGNAIWARRFGGLYWDEGVGIAVGNDGSLYATGSFALTADFDTPGVNTLTGLGEKEAYVTKLDEGGQLVWARAMGGAGADYGRGIAVGADGSVYTAVQFAGTADFDPGDPAFELTSGGGNDLALSQLDADGNFVSARGAGAGGDDTPYAVIVDAEGRAIVTGTFEATVDFDPGLRNFALTAASSVDAFLWSLTPSHAPTQVRLLANTVAENQAPGTAVGAVSCMDSDPDDTLIYRLVPGTGDADNHFFHIDADGMLRTSVVLDYEAKSSYQVRIRSTDVAGLWTESALTINVIDVSDGITVTGRVWNDLDSDGIQDAGEPGIAGATVQACFDFDGVRGNDDDVSWEIAVTDAGGAYALPGFSAGRNYYLLVQVGAASPAYQFSPQGIGGDATTDSDVDPEGLTAIFRVAAGEEIALDAGLIGSPPGIGFAIGLGSGWYNERRDVATDSAGNIYEIGSFRGTIDFDPGPGTYTLTSIAKEDVFVIKYTSAGTLAWVRQFRGTGSDIGYGIALGPDGSVYTTGSFSATADFDPGTQIYNLFSSDGFHPDTFVSKLDADGNFVWADQLRGAFPDTGNGIAVPVDGSVYVTGRLAGKADLDPGPGTYNLPGGTSETCFVLKLDPSGRFAWAIPSPEVQPGSEKIALGLDGSVYIAGTFQGTFDFDPEPGVYSMSSQGQDAFVFKLDAGGHLLWARVFGGAEHDRGNGIALGPDGSVYTTGDFSGTVDFDPGPGIDNLSSGATYSSDAFVSKLNPAGELLWVRALGGSLPSRGWGVTVGLDGSVYTAVEFLGTVDFDPGGSVFNLDSAGSDDIAVSQLDQAGNFVSARRAGGTGDDRPYGLAVTTEGRVIVAGRFAETADFDPGSREFSVTAASFADSFLWSLSPPHAPTDLLLSNNACAENQPAGTRVGTLSSVDVDPNDAFVYRLVAGEGDTDNASFAIDAAGNLVAQIQFDYETRAAYSVRLRGTDCGGMWFEKVFTIAVLVGDRPGLYVPDQGAFFLNNQQEGGDAEHVFSYGLAGTGWIELVGDWNGDDVDTPGMYAPATSTFYLSNRLAGGDAEYVFNFGIARKGWKPLVGDWDGDGRDSVGLYEPETSLFFFKNTLSGGDADEAVQFGVGSLGWQPIVGDWDGLPGDGFGFYEPATSLFFLKNAHISGPAEEASNSAWATWAGYLWPATGTARPATAWGSTYRIRASSS